MNIVCWSTGLQRVVPLRDQSGETMRTACRNNWQRPCGRHRVLVIDQQCSLCSGIFAEKVGSDGTRLEVTPLEAPWRNGKTERAVKDWKEDYCKMTQNGAKAQTWTDFEEDCDALNQARASKINGSGYSACQRVFGTTDGRCHFGMRESRPWGRKWATSRRTDTGTVDDYETPCPPSKSKLGFGSRTPLETSLAPCSETRPGRTTCWTTPLVLATWSDCSQETNKCFLAPRRYHQQHFGHSLDSLPRFRCQVCTISGAFLFGNDETLETRTLAFLLVGIAGVNGVLRVYVVLGGSATLVVEGILKILWLPH